MMLKQFVSLACIIAVCNLPFKVAGQLHISAVGKNYVEIGVYNQTPAIKQTINPYFLGSSKLKGNTYTFNLLRHRYRFYNDTLFLYLNDTAIVPGIEKYNQLDSLRLLQVKKYTTLNPQEEINVRYGFPNKAFSFVMLYYTFDDVSNNSEYKATLLYARKRKTK